MDHKHTDNMVFHVLHTHGVDYFANNVVFDGVRNVELMINDLIQMLQCALVDVIDYFITNGIREIKDINYYITGTKAIYNMCALASRSSIEQPFIYDIRVEKPEHIPDFCVRVAERANSDAREYYNTLHKTRIFQILKEMNLVTNEQKDFYLNENIFYVGIYGPNTTNGIKSIVLRLPMRNDLFSRNNRLSTYTNLVTGPTSNTDIYLHP